MCAQQLGLQLLSPISHTQSLLPSATPPGCQGQAAALSAPCNVLFSFCSLPPRAKETFWRPRPFSCEYIPAIPPNSLQLHPSLLQALLLSPPPALTMAREQEEPIHPHFPERCWEPWLQAIDPSVQVCLGIVFHMEVLEWRASGWGLLCWVCALKTHQGCSGWHWTLCSCLGL